MEPLVPLVIGFVVGRVAGLLGVDTLDGWQQALRFGLALMFLFTAYAHFRPGHRGQLIEMVPPELPRPDVLVTVTGVLEVLGAIGLLIPATTKAAAVCLILLLIAMFPANVSAARRRTAHGDPLPLRGAVQGVFVIALVLTLF